MSEGIPAAPQVWVDADACPGPVKEILFRAAERAQVQVTLVANQWLRTPPSRFIRALQVQGATTWPTMPSPNGRAAATWW